MNQDYKCCSILAPYIEGLIQERRKLGFSYQFEEYLLKVFDDYCVSKKLQKADFNKEFLSDWLKRKDSESSSYHSQRISFIRQLAVYMNSLGIRSYIPDITVKKETVIPRFLSNDEVKKIFDILDEDIPKTSSPAAWRAWNEYRIMFRLLYCCGMRNSEVCTLRTGDIDLEKGIMTIYHSKGDKDRLIYVSEDMKELLNEYYKYLLSKLGCCPYWFFPSRNIKKHVDKTTLCYRFNQIWKKVYPDNKENKKPTVHSLRHSFVVNRMNSWLNDGLDFDCMMPYLSKYLGHSSPSESFYYYHLNEEANRLIRQKDHTVEKILPEVSKYGN